MDSFYIITNEKKDPGHVTTESVAEYLRSRGKTCRLAGDVSSPDADGTDSGIPSDAECVLVLGGDGTMIRAAAEVVDYQIPLFGINLGTLGYLAEVDLQSVYPALDRLMNGSFTVENRMRVRGKVFRDGALVGEGASLNEIVIGRDDGMKMLKLNVYVNDDYLYTYHADGIIIATPTGSTAYNLSAGGPIVDPAASLFVMTPLAPHTLNTRSVILPPENVITVEIASWKNKESESAMAYFDGEKKVPLCLGDRIVIDRAERVTKIIKISDSSFLEILRRKMAQV